MDNPVTYTIVVNNQNYSLRCSDGEDHVKLIEDRLQKAVAELATGGVTPSLSAYAMKIAILLADQGVRDGLERQTQESLVRKRLLPLVQELDQVLGSTGESSLGVAR